MGAGRGRGATVNELFFTKNPNLILFIWGGEGEWAGGHVVGGVDGRTDEHY